MLVGKYPCLGEIHTGACVGNVTFHFQLALKRFIKKQNLSMSISRQRMGDKCNKILMVGESG